MMEVNTSHIKSTNPININSPYTLISSTVVVQVIYSGRQNSWNVTFVILNIVPHNCATGSFSCVIS